MLESLQKELSKIGSNIAREILVSACDTAAKYDAELARRVRIFLGPESEDAPALKKRTPPPRECERRCGGAAPLPRLRQETEERQHQGDLRRLSVEGKSVAAAGTEKPAAANEDNSDAAFHARALPSSTRAAVAAFRAERERRGPVVSDLEDLRAAAAASRAVPIAADGPAGQTPAPPPPAAVAEEKPSPPAAAPDPAPRVAKARSRAKPVTERCPECGRDLNANGSCLPCLGIALDDEEFILREPRDVMPAPSRNLDVAKERNCLKCGVKFTSLHRGNRLCAQCGSQNEHASERAESYRARHG